MSYINNYSSPEEFIRKMITANMGTDSLMYKHDMIKLAESKGLSSEKKALKAMNKDELYDLLIGSMTAEELAIYAHVGISSFEYQQNFDIDNSDVKFMASHGFIAVTGKARFRAFGKYHYADLYSCFDYFRLTKEDVWVWLTANRPKYKKQGKDFENDKDRPERT